MASTSASITHGLDLTKYSDWQIFVERLKKLVSTGKIRKITPLPSHYFAAGDEWYLDPVTGEIYVHGIPNAPRLPSWEKFDIADTQKSEPHANDLSVIPQGEMGAVETHSLKAVLALLMGRGAVEAIVTKSTWAVANPAEARFRDTKTNMVYRLIETEHGMSRWEKVPQGVLNSERREPQ